jgi:hypothetical protein
MSIKSAAAFVESSGWPYPDPFVKIIAVLLEIKKKKLPFKLSLHRGHFYIQLGFLGICTVNA